MRIGTSNQIAGGGGGGGPPQTVTITTSALPTTTAGSAYSATLAATGGTTPYTWSMTGAPSWLVLNTATGALSGTAGAAGTTSVTFNVHDSANNAAAPVTLSLIVNAQSAIVVSFARDPGRGTVGWSYGVARPASATGGVPPYVFTTSNLPPGLNMLTTGNWYQAVPTAKGNWTSVITAKDSQGATGSLTYIFSMDYDMNAVGGAVIGGSMHWQMTPNGGTSAAPPYTWSLSGQPSWMSIGASTGIITGTPSAVGNGSVNVTLVDAQGFSTTAARTWAVVASVDPPSRMGPGSVQSSRVVTTWWPAHSAVADSYNLYRSDMPNGAGVPYQTGLVGRIWYDNGSVYQYWAVDTAVIQGATYSYYVTGVISGVESVAGPSVSITVPNGQVSVASPPTPPAAVADPSTWIVPFALPTGGTTWTATNTNDNSGTTAGVPGTGTKNATNCSFQYALSNALPGDIIVLTAGATYRSTASLAVSGGAYVAWVMGAQIAGPGWVYIISSETPEYKTGGKLIARVDSPYDKDLTPLTLTATVAASGTSATLTSAWTGRTGRFYTMFFGLDGLQTVQFITVTYTNGSTAMTWLTPLPDGAASSIAVASIEGILPSDRSNGSMAILQFAPAVPGGNGNCIGYNAANKNIRWVGLSIEPLPMGDPSMPLSGGQIYASTECFTYPLSSINYTTDWSVNAAPPLDHIYYDRMKMGSDLEQPWSQVGTLARVTLLNCNHTYISQCCADGVWSPNGPTDNNTIAPAGGGGPCCIRNSILEACSECLIQGGLWAAEANLCHDITLEGCQLVKNTTWLSKTWDSSYPLANNSGILGSPGCKIKNHFEFKQGNRARVHGNLNVICYMSSGGSGSQRGRSFVWTPVDQTSGFWQVGNTYYASAFGTQPWNAVKDVDLYNNRIYCVGEAMYSVGLSSYGNPGCCLARVHFHNNMIFINPPIDKIQPSTTEGIAFPFLGSVVDLRYDHNTIIYNYASPNFSGGGNPTASYQACVSLFTAAGGSSVDAPPDRVLFCDNICDNGGNFVGRDGMGATGPSVLTGFTNSLFTNNIIFRDSRTYTGNFYVSDYTGAGFATLPGTLSGVYRPPVPANQWNIASGTYLTAATDGTAIGAHF